MSRGPGDAMRFVLAHLSDDVPTTAWSLAAERRHDRDCGCDDYGHCKWNGQPTRAELVTIRRAMHTLAARGDARLYKVGYNFQQGPRHLGAMRCLDAKNGALGNRYRPVDRCRWCNRLSTNIAPVGSLLGTGRGEHFECAECTSGTVDALAVVQSGAASEVHPDAAA